MDLRKTGVLRVHVTQRGQAIATDSASQRPGYPAWTFGPKPGGTEMKTDGGHGKSDRSRGAIRFQSPSIQRA